MYICIYIYIYIYRERERGRERTWRRSAGAEGLANIESEAVKISPADLVQ